MQILYHGVFLPGWRGGSDGEMCTGWSPQRRPFRLQVFQAISPSLNGSRALPEGGWYGSFAYTQAENGDSPQGGINEQVIPGTGAELEFEVK